MANEEKKIKKIVLTGGPCAGKTTALMQIIDHFSSLGYQVFTRVEVPTMLSQSGLNFMTPNAKLLYEGEKATLELYMDIEDKLEQMARVCDEPCVIICDRGALDIAAYVSDEMWNTLVESVGETTASLKARYDAVLHLVSAAEGAEQFYTLATNAQRYEKADAEGLQLARELDHKVLKAWSGHPHIRVINNQIDFERKIKQVLKEISHVLELPQHVEEERMYLVEVTGEIPRYIESEIVQSYLVADPGCEVRLRHREWGSKSVNVHTTRKIIGGGEELVSERQVSNNLYESLLQQRDPYRNTIRKTRKSFVWKGQFFQLDTYHDELDGLVVLEMKGTHPNDDELRFPPFIKVVEEVTGRQEYYAYNLALKR